MNFARTASEVMGTSSGWPQPPLSDGEINFLWSFMDGSIMVPETRWRLRHAWGMCQRHSFGWVAMEATLRHGFLMGPAVLYEDLMERAAQAFRLRGPGKAPRLARRLRERGPCLMCELDYGPESKATAANPWVLERARGLANIRAFARATEQWWRPAVCGRCAGDGGGGPLPCPPGGGSAARRGGGPGGTARVSRVDLRAHGALFARLRVGVPWDRHRGGPGRADQRHRLVWRLEAMAVAGRHWRRPGVRLARMDRPLKHSSGCS